LTLDLIVWASGEAEWGRRRFRSALGRGGVRVDKREGDGATPVGRWPMRRLFYRADRLAQPKTALPVRALDPADGWSDDPTDAAYNRLIRLPHAPSHERLWREDAVYDLIVELGYNDAPPKSGLGSAIFLHLARADWTPTEGCVALALADLLQVLETCDDGSAVEVRAED
jgi:L,D-peptidoglycan transpeptidase YkuD (ErfK/YbiS/YcfS/YnhG family)